MYTMASTGGRVAKRYRDTEIWGKEWYVSLTCAERCAIDYILCRCDPVGVWPPAFSVAERLIGEPVNWDELPAKTNGNLVVLPNGKWLVTDFVDFQYGKLRETCKPHLFYLALLEKHGLAEGYAKGTRTLKEKELEKEKEKEDKEELAPGILLTTSEHEKLVMKYGVESTKAAYAKLSAYKLQSGKRYASDYGAILHWVMDEVVKREKASGKPGKRDPRCPKCGDRLVGNPDEIQRGEPYRCMSCKADVQQAEVGR
jgi:DNA-directed RNA polymerase subunit RPC12/RpoP